MRDSYYDPPDEEGPCQICHHMECECPECKECGVAGDPACINTHMTWREWGHFLFKPTAKELEEDLLRYKDEMSTEEMQRINEYEMWRGPRPF